MAGALGTQASRRASAAEAYTLRCTVPQPQGSAAVTSLLHFAAGVRRRSNGQVTIEVYPNGQLTTQQGSIDGLASGIIDLASQSSAFLVGLVPQYQVFDTPFLFKNFANAYRVLDGPIGDEFFAQLEQKGILGLGWIGSFKELESSAKSVVVPADMKGLRIRIQASAVYAATYQALGAIPVVIDSAETLISLSNHTVDACDQNLDIIATGQYWTVIKHVAMLNQYFSLTPLMGSKRKIEALPLPIQRIIKEEAKATLPFWRSLITKQTAEDIKILKQNGVAFTEPQTQAFRKMVDPVYAMVQAKLGGDLLERVSRAASSS
jgi:TRAP-type transport system periplasmic protein